MCSPLTGQKTSQASKNTNAVEANHQVSTFLCATQTKSCRSLLQYNKYSNTHILTFVRGQVLIAAPVTADSGTASECSLMGVMWSFGPLSIEDDCDYYCDISNDKVVCVMVPLSYWVIAPSPFFHVLWVCCETVAWIQGPSVGWAIKIGNAKLFCICHMTSREAWRIPPSSQKDDFFWFEVFNLFPKL